MFGQVGISFLWMLKYDLSKGSPEILAVMTGTVEKDVQMGVVGG